MNWPLGWNARTTSSRPRPLPRLAFRSNVQHLRGIAFDLFNTLVVCDYARLPQVVLRGRAQPSTLPHVQEELAVAGHEVELERLGAVVRAISIEQEAEKRRTGREFPSSYRWTAVLAELDITPTEALVEAVVQQHMTTMCGAWDMTEADRTALQRLGDRYPLALLSNFDHGPSARALLARLDLTSSFAYVGISDELGWRKPEPRVFADVLAALELEPAHCLYVGDSPEFDLAGAEAAGMPSAWINRKDAVLPEAFAPPAFCAASVAELEPQLTRPMGD